jgi:hypothetical protein
MISCGQLRPWLQYAATSIRHCELPKLQIAEVIEAGSATIYVIRGLHDLDLAP